MSNAKSLIAYLFTVCLTVLTSAQPQAYTSDLFPNVFNDITSDSLETPLQIRAFFYLNLAVFNSWASYHPTAVDCFGRGQYRRPESEHTTLNKNTAIYYAILRMFQASPLSFGDPTGASEAKIRKSMIAQGLDPDDESLDMTTPIGIGNRAGIDTGKLLLLDGWNADGSRVTKNPAYALPFSDYTEYTPINAPWEIAYPLRWQPVLENNGKGFFFHQEHITPYAGQTIAFSETPDQFDARRTPPPYLNSDADIHNADRNDLNNLRHDAKNVFKASAALTEEQRLLAELFDNKVLAFKTPEQPFGTLSIAAAVRFAVFAPQLNLSLDDDVIYGMAANVVALDATVAAWKEKVRNDAIRPTPQTMEFLFGDEEEFEVWGGPDNADGTTRIKAKDWQPYLRTMPHSEYPSGSACVCEAFVEQALAYTKGRNNFPYTLEFTQGSSKFYPGKVPSKNITIEINTLTEWNDLCGESRLWSGVHFKPSIKAGKDLCKGLGKAAQNVVDKWVAGEPDLTWLKWLPDDVGRFWEMETEDGLGECEGDCDSDSDCATGLFCADDHRDELVDAGLDKRRAYCTKAMRGGSRDELCFDPKKAW